MTDKISFPTPTAASDTTDALDALFTIIPTPNSKDREFFEEDVTGLIGVPRDTLGRTATPAQRLARAERQLARMLEGAKRYWLRPRCAGVACYERQTGEFVHQTYPFGVLSCHPGNSAMRSLYEDIGNGALVGHDLTATHEMTRDVALWWLACEVEAARRSLALVAEVRQ